MAETSVRLHVQTRQVMLSVSAVSDKLMTSSRLAVAMSADGLQHGCDARIPKEGADMEGVASTGVPC